METHIIVALSLALLILLFVTWKDRNVHHKLRTLETQIGELKNLVKALPQNNQKDVLAEMFRQKINVLADVARQVDELQAEIVQLEGVRLALTPIAFTKPPPDLFKDSPYWRKLSDWMREEKRWACEKCGIDLKGRRSDLHTHHIFGRGFNSPQHLKVLCIACHADEPHHEFMKAYPEYKAFLTWKRRF